MKMRAGKVFCQHCPYVIDRQFCRFPKFCFILNRAQAVTKAFPNVSLRCLCQVRNGLQSCVESMGKAAKARRQDAFTVTGHPELDAELQEVNMSPTPMSFFCCLCYGDEVLPRLFLARMMLCGSSGRTTGQTVTALLSPENERFCFKNKGHYDGRCHTFGESRCLLRRR
jgi:hypothetical protein